MEFILYIWMQYEIYTWELPHIEAEQVKIIKEVE